MEVIDGLKIKFDLCAVERSFHMKLIKLHSIINFQILFSLQFVILSLKQLRREFVVNNHHLPRIIDVINLANDNNFVNCYYGGVYTAIKSSMQLFCPRAYYSISRNHFFKISKNQWSADIRINCDFGQLLNTLFLIRSLLYFTLNNEVFS